MKAPKHPTPPRKMLEPKQPKETVQKYVIINKDCPFDYDSETTLSALKKFVDDAYAELPSEIRPEHVVFRFDVSYAEASLSYIAWVPNPNLERETKEYQAKLAKYNASLNEYKEKFKQYERELQEYEIERTKYETHILQEKLKKMQKKLNTLKGGTNER